MLQGLTRDNLRSDRYWGQMQRLGGTLSHMLKEVLSNFPKGPCRAANLRNLLGLAAWLSSLRWQPCM